MAGGPGFDSGTDIAMDTLNNVVVTGRFGLWSRESGTSYFGNTNLDSVGDHHHFEMSIDSGGAVQWAAKAHRRESRTFNSRAVDAEGNSYETGRFSGTTSWGNINRTSAGLGDVFLTKRDGMGEFQWAVQYGGPSDDSGNAVVVDDDGRIYVAGRFSGNASFDGFKLMSRGGADIFVACVTRSGEVEWAVSLGGEGRDVAYGLALDVRGDVYATGAFVGNVYFGAHGLASNGGADIFVVKLARSDRSVRWAVGAGSLVDDAGHGVVLDGDAAAYVTGEFRDSATFGETTLSSRGIADVFVMKVNGSSSP